MRRLFKKCPKCNSENIRTQSTITHVRIWKQENIVEDYHVTTDADTTRCLNCGYEETPK